MTLRFMKTVDLLLIGAMVCELFQIGINLVDKPIERVYGDIDVLARKSFLRECLDRINKEEKRGEMRIVIINCSFDSVVVINDSILLGISWAEFLYETKNPDKDSTFTAVGYSHSVRQLIVKDGEVLFGEVHH